MAHSFITGMIRALVAAAGLLVASSMVIASQAKPLGRSGPLRIAVIKGEDAVNIIQQKTAVAPVIEVRDQNNIPVPGAVVTFSIGQGASFAGGVQTFTAVTNAIGQATAAGLVPTASGALEINATVAFQGQIATATISQTNVLTAVQAAAAGTSGASGATASAAGGGGLSATTIGVVGAAVGAGTLVATQAGGDNGAPGSSTSAAESVSDGSWTGSGRGASSNGTSAQIEITFRTVANLVSQFQYAWRVDTVPGTIQSTFCGGNARKDDFRIGRDRSWSGLTTGDIYDIEIRGSFTSSTSVTGTLELQRRAAAQPWCLSASIPWSAALQ